MWKRNSTCETVIFGNVKKKTIIIYESPVCEKTTSIQVFGFHYYRPLQVLHLPARVYSSRQGEAKVTLTCCPLVDHWVRYTLWCVNEKSGNPRSWLHHIWTINVCTNYCSTPQKVSLREGENFDLVVALSEKSGDCRLAFSLCWLISARNLMKTHPRVDVAMCDSMQWLKKKRRAIRNEPGLVWWGNKSTKSKWSCEGKFYS